MDQTNTIEVIVAVGYDGRCCLLHVLTPWASMPDVWGRMVVESVMQNIDDAYAALGEGLIKTPPGIYKTTVIADDITEEDKNEWVDRDVCAPCFEQVDFGWSQAIKLQNPWEGTEHEKV